MSTLPDEVKDRIRYVAKRHGSLAAVARTTEISYRTLVTWLGGVSIPNTKQLIIIHDRLNVSIDWLLFGVGQPPVIQKEKHPPFYYRKPNATKVISRSSTEG